MKSLSKEALEWLSKEGYDPQFGARPVKRILQKKVLNELSKEILAGKIQKDADIVLDVFNDQCVFRNPIELDKPKAKGKETDKKQKEKSA
jgi:ATP-dependent Clp protease ATP-binding subunit ClpB